MSGTVERTALYPLASIFPTANYKNAGRAMALHYLVALDQPEDNIRKWLDKNPEYLNFSEKKHLSLTPLSVCVIVNNKRIAQLFLDRGADPKIGDHQGWTAFHHAAVVGDQEMFMLLTQKVNESIAEKLLNFACGTYKDLQELITSRQVSPQENVCYYREEGKEVTECTAEKFRSLTGAFFCHSALVSPKELIKYWRDPKYRKTPSPLTETCEKGYQKYLKNPPKISFGKDSPETLYGFDVFAEEDLKESQVITVYGGTVDRDLPHTTHTIYTMDAIHSEKFRNLGAMINDGFPNCSCTLIITKGFIQFLFIAIRDIKKGEKILFNYGLTHPTKIRQLHPHFELNPGDLEKYVASGDLIKTLRALATKASVSLAEREKIKYFLETPSSLLYLLSKNALKLSDLLLLTQFLESEYSKTEIFNGTNIEDRKKFIMFFFKIEGILQAFLASGQDKLVENIRTLFFEWHQTFPISVLMAEESYIRNSFKTSLKSIQDFPEFKNSINKQLNGGFEEKH